MDLWHHGLHPSTTSLFRIRIASTTGHLDGVLTTIQV